MASATRSADAGSATAGTVNWWGWTPTDVATAQGYISAFNAEFPDIKVNFKLVAIADWQAALPPALRSDAGPDVCRKHTQIRCGLQKLCWKGEAHGSEIRHADKPGPTLSAHVPPFGVVSGRA